MKARKTTKNFAEIIRKKLASDPELARAVAEEKLHADIAAQILRLRGEANISQKELAERVGTQQSVISRIEDDDYAGHSLSLLLRISEALGMRLQVEFRELPVVVDREVSEFSISWATDKWDAVIKTNEGTLTGTSPVYSPLACSGSI